MRSVSERKTNTVWFHSYVEFKKQNNWTEREKKKQIMKQTFNYRGKTEGYWRGKGQEDGLNRWWVLRRALVMSTGCFFKWWFSKFYIWTRKKIKEKTQTNKQTHKQKSQMTGFHFSWLNNNLPYVYHIVYIYPSVVNI